VNADASAWCANPLAENADTIEPAAVAICTVESCGSALLVMMDTLVEAPVGTGDISGGAEVAPLMESNFSSNSSMGAA